MKFLVKWIVFDTDEELETEVKDYYPHLLEPSISELEATADDYGCGK